MQAACEWITQVYMSAFFDRFKLGMTDKDVQADFSAFAAREDVNAKQRDALIELIGTRDDVVAAYEKSVAACVSYVLTDEV